MTTTSTGIIQSGAKQDGAIADILAGGAGSLGSANDEQEAEKVRKVKQMLIKAKSWKAQWSKDHDRWWNYWESNHWRGRIAKTITQAVVNVVWSEIETFIGHILDALPEPIARARRQEMREKAKLASKWLAYEVDANDLEQELLHPVRSAAVTGAGWLKVDWNWMLGSGQGDVEIKARDEKYMFPAPYARNIVELAYLQEAMNVPREYVLRTWPEKGPLVPPGTTDGSLWNIRQFAEPQTTQTAPNAAILTTTTGSDSRWTGSRNIEGSKRTDLVTLIHTWTRDEEGRMRLLIVANDVLLEDDYSPYDDDDYPYAVFNLIPTLDTIQGRSLIQFIEGLQDLLNATVSNLIDQQRFSADPMMGVASTNLEEAQLLENQPGSILPDAHLAAQGSPGYYWLQGPGFNQAWLQIQEIMNGYMDSILGRVDILRGERPAGVNTLGGLEIVREQANIRVRSMLRWVHASLKRVFKLTLSRLRQFAKDERRLRIVGKAGREEFVTVNPVTGVALEGGLQQDFTIEDEFDVELAKQAPGGKQAELELALTLAGTPAEDGLPMVDRQYVLEKAIEDEAPDVIARLAQMAAAQAQAQAQPTGAPGQAAPTQPDPMEVIQSLFAGGPA